MSTDLSQINPSLAVLGEGLGWFFMEAQAGMDGKVTAQNGARKDKTGNSSKNSSFLPNCSLFPESNLHLSVSKMFLTRIKCKK